MEMFIDVRGVRVPRLAYGTAWKEDRTAELTALALANGFRGIDTANQRKRYHEAGVGAALAVAGVARGELFLQTKFTYARGQDHRLPYDPRAPVAQQVAQSFASSLEHLGVDAIDSYVLHGPESGRGWTTMDRETWGAMEALHRDGRARLLGVSNVSGDQRLALCDAATVPPSIVQNRCYARDRWDHDVRTICSQRGILYQGFSLLTANARELGTTKIAAIAKRHGATIPQLVFRFAYAVGMIALTGTSSPLHMQQDLAAVNLELDAGEIATIERAGG